MAEKSKLCVIELLFGGIYYILYKSTSLSIAGSFTDEADVNLLLKSYKQ